MLHKLSIIIPTRNRHALLKLALHSFRRQTYPQDHYEVIVVDNGSKDDTKSICQSIAHFFHRFHYLYDSRPGLHIGRNLGMQKASNEILVFADDDIEASPSWLSAINNSFQDKSVALVGGKILPKFETDPPDWIKNRWRDCTTVIKTIPSLSIIDMGDRTMEVSPLYIYGCNFSIRKNTLLKSGGFHPDAMPSDHIMLRGDGETHVSRFIRENGYKAIYNPDASVTHWVPRTRMTNAYFYQRAFRQGISDSFTLIRSCGKTFTPPIIWHFFFKSLRLIIGNPLERSIRKAYLQGFLNHQVRARKDSELLKWVLKKDYFD